MGKSFKNLTVKTDESIVAKIRYQSELEEKLGIEDVELTSAHNSNLPPYDESNEQYKEYEHAENSFSLFMYNEEPIPDELVEYLLRTKDQRKLWHQYKSTHYRQQKTPDTDTDIVKRLEAAIMS